MATLKRGGNTAKIAAMAIASALAMSGCGVLGDNDNVVVNHNPDPVMDTPESMPQSGDQAQSAQSGATKAKEKKDEKKVTASPTRPGGQTTTNTTRLTPTEARALDAQGLTDGVVSRTQTLTGQTVTVTRDGDTLTVTTTPAPNGGVVTAGGVAGGSVIKASDQDKPSTPGGGTVIAKPADPVITPAPGGDGAVTGTPAVGTDNGGSTIPAGSGNDGDAGSAAGNDGNDATGGSGSETPSQPDGGTENPGTPSTPGTGDGSGSTTTPSKPVEDPKTDPAVQYAAESSKYMDTVRSKMVELVNKARLEAGVGILKVSYDQTISAQNWADMALEKGFSGWHVKDWADEHNDFELPDGVIKHRSEVIATYHGNSDNRDRAGKGTNTATAAAEAMFRALYNEPGHQKAMLDPKATYMGIGVAMAQSTTVQNTPIVETVIQFTTDGILAKAGKTGATTTLKNPGQETFVDDPSDKYKASATPVASNNDAPNTSTDSGSNNQGGADSGSTPAQPGGGSGSDNTDNNPSQPDNGSGGSTGGDSAGDGSQDSEPPVSGGSDSEPAPGGDDNAQPAAPSGNSEEEALPPVSMTDTVNA